MSWESPRDARAARVRYLMVAVLGVTMVALAGVMLGASGGMAWSLVLMLGSVGTVLLGGALVLGVRAARGR